MSDKLKILRVENAYDLPLPSRGSEKASGLDLYANVPDIVIINPGEIETISAGIKLVIPEGYEVQVRSRSGLAAKDGVAVLNSPGTIDEDYRGEIFVILINNSKWKQFFVKRGMRIAQMVLCKVERNDIEEINEEEFNKYQTIRGDGKFGSTGK